MGKSHVVTLENAKDDLYNLIQKVNEHNNPVIIKDNQSGKNAVLISEDDWIKIQETLSGSTQKLLDKVREREKDNSGFTNVDDIDWDNLDN